MIKNYFKVAIRNIFKTRTYSFINVFGLGLGLAAGFIMLFWVNNEYSMNRYHSNANRIYQINAKLKFGTDLEVWENTPAPVALFSKENISGIEQIARLKGDYGSKQAIRYNNKVFIEEKIGYTENDFFKIFDFPIVAGNPNEPFSKGLSAVLPESIARKYFGNENPIGKIITFRDTTFLVSAVMKDFPPNSSIQFNVLFSLDIVKLRFRGNGQWKTVDQDWGNFDYSTFCLMKKDANLVKASSAILGALKKANPESSIMQFPFRPLKDLYLYKPDGTKGRIIMVEIFFIVAIFILLIASINYINLVTARATQRIKEISVRKIIGAEKIQLFWQFFIETGILLLLACLTSLFLIKLLLPVYQQVSGNKISYDPLSWQMWKVLVGIIASVWLLTGIYPALLLSSFRPLDSLRGKTFVSNAGILRKALVVIQFIVSITLMLGTVFIHRQMNYIRHKELHINTDNVLVLPVWQLKDKGGEFKNQLQQSSYIPEITTANISMFEGINTTTDLDWPGKQEDQTMWIAQFDVDKNFMNFFHTKLKEGADFEKTSAGSPEFILNETAVRKMGLQNPIGQTIKFHERAGVIIGIVEDFHFESLHKELGPMLMEYQPDRTPFIYARVQQKDVLKTLSFAQKIWKKYESVLPLEYSFLDDQLAKQYDKETRASKLFDAFALITMFISCLGLFGLATYSAERRVKEIGIRKVLGADIGQIAALLSKEFVGLILIAIVIAIPIVWIGMDKLLKYFAYRISLQWEIFIITCGAAVFIAIATVSFQAIKAALANPVKSLRME
jgi:putative ABC transport system permease protein